MLDRTIALFAILAVLQPASPLPKQDALEFVKRATESSSGNLATGEGRGTFRQYREGTLVLHYTFEVVFARGKFNLRLTDNTRRVSKESPAYDRLVVSDGSAIFSKPYGTHVQDRPRTGEVYSPKALRETTHMPWSLDRVARGPLDPAVFAKFAVRMETLPNGRVRGTYDLNKRVGARFEAAPDAGYNVVLFETFNKEGPQAGTRAIVDWSRQDGLWYVSALVWEKSLAGVVHERIDLRYDRFTANRAVSPDLFTLQALALREGSRVIDLRPGPSKAYTVGDPQKIAERKLDTIAAQVESLPLVGQTKELERNSGIRGWLWALNVIAILAIAGIWYAYWHRRRIARGKSS